MILVFNHNNLSIIVIALTAGYYLIKRSHKDSNDNS